MKKKIFMVIAIRSTTEVVLEYLVILHMKIYKVSATGAGGVSIKYISSA